MFTDIDAAIEEAHWLADQLRLRHYVVQDGCNLFVSQKRPLGHNEAYTAIPKRKATFDWLQCAKDYADEKSSNPRARSERPSHKQYPIYKVVRLAHCFWVTEKPPAGSNIVYKSSRGCAML